MLLLVATKIITFYVASRFGAKWPLWMVATIWVLLLNIFKIEQIQEPIKEYLHISETSCYEIIIISSWIILKLISFTLDSVHQNSSINCIRENAFNVFNLLGYVFYFPTMMVGPIVIYKRYANMLKKNDDPLSVYQHGEASGRMKMLLYNLIKLGFWLMLTDFALHFVYVNNLMYNPQVSLLINSLIKVNWLKIDCLLSSPKILSNVNPWALYCFGYVMGQFFYNKYIVSYGFGLAFAAFDRINTPGLPKCIGRIHLYSDMWKYFDQGLYEFLFMYV